MPLITISFELESHAEVKFSIIAVFFPTSFRYINIILEKKSVKMLGKSNMYFQLQQ